MKLVQDRSPQGRTSFVQGRWRCVGGCVRCNHLQFRGFLAHIKTHLPMLHLLSAIFGCGPTRLVPEYCFNLPAPCPLKSDQAIHCSSNNERPDRHNETPHGGSVSKLLPPSADKTLVPLFRKPQQLVR